MRNILFVIILIFVIGISYFFNNTELFNILQENNFSINYYVITLNQSSRLENIKIQEKKLNKMINIITGVNGLELNQEELLDKRILSKDFYIKDDTKRSKEIGCYQSHMLIYKIINEKFTGFSVIFEDDFNIKGENLNLYLENIIKTMEKNHKPFDIIYLANTFDNVGLQVIDNIYSIDTNKFSVGTFGYLINNSSIGKIIDLTKLIDMAIDMKLDKLIKNSQLNCFVIYPNLISHDYSMASIVNPKN